VLLKVKNADMGPFHPSRCLPFTDNPPNSNDTTNFLHANFLALKNRILLSAAKRIFNIIYIAELLPSLYGVTTDLKFGKAHTKKLSLPPFLS
jgi:hypothetical protein